MGSVCLVGDTALPRCANASGCAPLGWHCRDRVEREFLDLIYVVKRRGHSEGASVCSHRQGREGR